MTVDRPRPLVATRDERGPGERVALAVDLDDLASVLADVLAAEGAPATAEASLQLVSIERMTSLNAEHLGGIGPTDVLSFPLDGIEDCEGSPEGCIVGDVVICPEVAAAQAPDHAGDLRSELDLLVVHGGLHLCGWDHDGAGDQARMWSRERALLERIGRTPSRDPWTPR